MEPAVIYEFGPFRLDPNQHAFLQSGQPVALPPKAFEILLLLLENRDTLLLKADLLNRVWPNTAVEENNLAQHVSLLRKVLGEHHLKPQYIETVPRVGYRFIGDVRLVSNGHRRELAREPNPWMRGRRLVAVCGAGLALAAGLAFLLRTKPAPAVLDYFQLTHDGYPKHSPLMADSGFVYFVETRGGANALVRVPSTGGEPAVLQGFLGAMQPLDMSPANHEMLMLEGIFTGVEHALWTWKIPGGQLHRLGELSASAAAWSVSGDSIFYARHQRLYRAKSDGSESKELLTAPGHIGSIRASPDGKLLSYHVQSDQRATNELWEAAVDGTHPREISTGLPPEVEHSVGTWTHDARSFLFPETGDGKEWIGVIRQPAFGLGGEERARLNTGLLHVAQLTASNQGKKIYVIGALDRVEILRHDAKTGGPVRYLPGASADGLAFSRTGDWVAYSTYPDRKLVCSRLDGSDRRELTGSSENALMPAWSPDGKHIAYMERAGSGPWKIRLIARDGGAVESLLPGDTDEGHPSWSPDGKSLIYGDVPWVKGFASSSVAIHQVELSTRKIVTLPDSSGLWSPRWSPDGNYLVAETLDSQRLMLFDFAKRAWKPLAAVNGTGTIGYTSWAHDSRYVYFNTYLYQRGTIYRVDVVGGITEKISAPEGTSGAITLGQWFGLTPDDSPLLLSDISVHEVFALDLRLP